MPLVVPGVCRFTVHQTYAGRPTENVIDIRIDTTGSVMSRTAAIQDQAEILIQAWTDRILPYQSNNLTADKVSFVDLDSATGDVGETSTGSGTATWPDPGGHADTAMPPNVSILVTKRVVAARGSKNGRLFQGGLVETYTTDLDPQRITDALKALLDTAWTNFMADVNQDGAATNQYDSRIAVVHILTRDAQGNPLTGNSRDVLGLVPQLTLATQRRRLRK